MASTYRRTACGRVARHTSLAEASATLTTVRAELTLRPMLALQRFLRANSRLSARLDARRELALYARYDAAVVAAARALPDGAVLVDVGGGAQCSFAAALGERDRPRLVGVDLSAQELARNTGVDEVRVADVTRELPFGEGEVDLLVSRTLLEHVHDLPRAVGNMARAVRPGGRTLHLVPCRYALFAIAARVLPFGLAKRALHQMIPEARGVVEFDVFYDHCHPAALERAFRAAGFEEVEVECTWDQAHYAHAFFPLFLVVMAYQRLAERAGLRRLASYAVVRATRS